MAQGRGRSGGGSARGIGLAVTLVVLLGCQVADQPTLAECGNGIVEPSAGEDCEPLQDPAACGAAGSGASACRFICTAQSCPSGFRCGNDAICRQPCLGFEGEPACNPFEVLSEDVSEAAIAQVSVVDVVGDARPEIIAVEYDDAQGLDAQVQVYRVEPDEIVTGESAMVGEFPGVVRLSSGGVHYLVAQRDALPLAPAEATASQRQAILSVLEPDLGFREVIIQGPTVVDPGPLRLASYAPSDELPGESVEPLLFGFGEDQVWQPEASAVEPAAAGHPDDLLGPSIGQPFDADQAAAAGALASQVCPVMVYGYRGQTQLFAENPCEDLVATWTALPLLLPELPADTRLGDGLVVGDANGDGLDDLAITTDAGRIHVAYGVGDGSFHSVASELPLEGGDGRFDDGVGFASELGTSLGVIAVGDFNGDARPDFLTRSTWIRSCTTEGCGTCDVEGYRCELGASSAPAYSGTAASVADYDGDGEIELAVLAREADDPLFPADQWGGVPPSPGDLVIIDRPGSEQWSARVIPMVGAPRLLASGDLDGDGADEVMLARSTEGGDELHVTYGETGEVESLGGLGLIVDAHVVAGTRTLAVVSEGSEGQGRRLTRLTATHERQLRSTVKLALEVVPRSFVVGNWTPSNPAERGLAVIGETATGEVGVELLTRGGDTFFDASTRNHALTSLQLAADQAASAQAVAIDLDGDDIDELVVLAADGAVRTLRVSDAGGAPAFIDPTLSPALEPFAGPAWPGDDRPRSLLGLRDLDDDGDLDLWALSAEDSPQLVAFRNLGDGTLDVAGRAVSPIPPLELSFCEEGTGDCSVHVRAVAPFRVRSDRSRSVSPTGIDLLLASRRALFLWTLDPLDPSTATALPVAELAVVRGGRLPLSPEGGQVLAAIGDIDGDGVDDVVAAGRNGIRWLNGLAVNP
ncbi:MAG: VCBS repeat-containing protein [Myxococcota bacterium]